jgi:hypothetical protein
MATDLRALAEMTTEDLVALKAETDDMIHRLNMILLKVIRGGADEMREAVIAVEVYLGGIEEELDRRHAREANLIAPDLGWPGR